MKVFVSWSGEYSREIAEVLKKWIPCIIQSVEVFFSPDDIEKGNNWDRILSSELSECNYGIVCLTSNNILAPWINFEAGAIAKSLESKVSALMVDVKPSDIKGPLSRYQATKLEKRDFFKLITSINNSLETPLELSVIENLFNAIWNSLEGEILKVTQKYIQASTEKIEIEENDPIEEVLQLLRTQNSLLTNPENLLPVDYMDYILNRINERNQESRVYSERTIDEVIMFLTNMLDRLERESGHPMIYELVRMFELERLFDVLLHSREGKRNKKRYMYIHALEKRYYEIINIHHGIIKVMDEE